MDSHASGSMSSHMDSHMDSHLCNHMDNHMGSHMGSRRHPGMARHANTHIPLLLCAWSLPIVPDGGA